MSWFPPKWRWIRKSFYIGLVMDTLSGRTPLYRLDEFFQDKDTELLLGKRINAAVFND
ncbi:MAG: DUF4277 domain-containing protein [Desulfobacterales bacterium]|jgi:hypothetical protein